MKFHQLRNATALIDYGPHRFLVDPMLCAPKSMPPFRLGSKERNPRTALPEVPLDDITGLLVTHDHPDHFDAAGKAFARDQGLPVWCNTFDVEGFRKENLDARPFEDGALGLRIEAVPTRHGRGLSSLLMGPVAGFYLSHPDEPSLYLTGDSVLTDTVRDAIEALRPEVIVAPAGAANPGFGGPILFTEDELIELAQKAPGTIVFNHLEALDHCPTTRSGLRERIASEGLNTRCWIPDDGEARSFAQRATPTAPRPQKPLRMPLRKLIARGVNATLG